MIRPTLSDALKTLATMAALVAGLALMTALVKSSDFMTLDQRDFVPIATGSPG